ncbi:MAG TPA: hypothetical protein ENH92_00885 [Ectothiorhodospiraceae bacterium]|nr:hypothetical protein [Ectothiorhodospiraceae bacterium]
MITKILFTLFIIIAAMLFMRHKNGQGRRLQHEREAQQAQQVDNRKTAMFVAIAFVSLTLAVSAGLYYSHWKEAHRIFSIRIINSHTGSEQSYHVYQGDINGRRFRTIDGRLINLADSERMEVQERTIDSNEYRSE